MRGEGGMRGEVERGTEGRRERGEVERRGVKGREMVGEGGERGEVERGER